MRPDDDLIPPRPAPRRDLNRVVLSRQLARRRVALRGGRRATMVVLALAGAIALLWGGMQVVLAVLDSTYGAVPQAHDLGADSLVYDRSGALIADMHPGGDTRIPVHLAEVSPLLVKATVDIEDRNFWSEGAIDAPRIAAAAWTDLRHGTTEQGASTITEQLAKVLYLDDRRTLDRKLRELFIARHLDTAMSKQAILEAYLNDIYYGHGATGIEAAARTYFGIPAAKLDLAQATLLAGLPNHPADLDLFFHMAAAQARQHQVLNAMIEMGDISPQMAAEAVTRTPALADGAMDNVNTFPAVSGRVAQEVHDRLGLDVYRAGLRITTTVDSATEVFAQETVTSQVNAIRGLHVSDGGLVALDPQTGEIIAYVGGAGPGHPGYQIDMAAHPRQPGSTFKIFTYSTAIAERKVTMLTPVADTPLVLPVGGGPFGTQPYEVHDYDMRYHGILPVEQALGNSLNIPAVRVEMLAGVPNVVKTAQTMGVTTLTQPPGSYGVSLTLGSYPVPLLEMAQAGGVLAAAGQLHPAHVLRSVTDTAGHQLLPAPAAPKQALDPGVAFIMNTMMSDDSNRTLEFGSHSALTIDGHRVAAKTGTTQDFRDNFTVGWTPHLAMAAWVGNTDNSPMRGTTGITGAAPIWHAVMQHALNGVSDDWPGPPSDVHPFSSGGRNAWTLNGADTKATAVGTSNVRYVGDCRYWTYNGADYWFCGSSMSGLPGDPGPQGGGGGAPPPPAPAPPTGRHHGHG